ncbi:MAG TPA: type IV toxin-antitoxin system AbiEi family antitoxin [Methylocella sp.]|nr:type IV toxin-antitoxin system AbiEi family antitoxin [Methylocella sp.]
MNYDPEKVRPGLSSYVTGLLAAGRLIFSRDEAQAAIGIAQGAFLDAAEKLQKRGRLLNARQGFYVIVPPQHLNFGSPPPASFIDDLMRHEKRPYYVGLLKAAELHGAAHHAVMEFQVVTNKQMQTVQAGRSKIAFYFKKDISAVASGIEESKTDTGKMKISTVELTLFDLLRYPRASGGLDNVLTVFEDLGPKIEAGKISALSGAFERSVVQRAGYLLDHSGFAQPAEELHAFLERASHAQWTELDPSLASDSDLAPKIIARDERWHVLVRRLPERDE